MRKNIIICACAAAAMILASCQKEDNIGGTPQGKPEGFETITASTQPTRTTTENGVDVLWKNGDVIGVFCGEVGNPTSATFTTSATVPSSTAVFTSSDANTPAKIEDYYFAAYPQSGINQWYYSTNGGGVYRLYFTFNKEQTAVKNGWDPIHGAMAAKSTDNDFSFEHYSAYIKFTVGASSSSFKSVTVTTKDGTNIVDRLRIDLPAMTYSANNLNSLRSPYVTLTTSDGNNFEQGTYYISIIPRNYPEGFSLSFETTDGKVAIKNVPGNFTFDGGDVADLGTVGTLIFETAGALELGTVYREGGKNQGVVFWIDPSDPKKGKIVSVSTTSPIVWADNQYTSDATGGNLGGTNTTNGLANFNQVTSFAAYQADPNHFPAMKFCADLRTSLGGNWYLPVAGELQTLYNAYYGLSVTSLTNNTDYRRENSVLIQSTMDTKAQYDAAFRLMGETTTATLDDDTDYDGVSGDTDYGTANGVQYWTSKVNNTTNNSNTQYVRFGIYSNATGTKTTTKHVRCIREVQIN